MPTSDEIYQKRYTAYLDILGFKDLVDKSESNPDILKKIIKASALVNAFKDSVFLDQRDINLKAMQVSSFQMTAFSDSILISTLENAVGISMIMTLVPFMCLALLDEGIFVRGGISKGNLLHDDRMAIGKGLINAYEIESKHAIYPRVIIDPIVISDLKLIESRENQKSILRKQDFDGLWYVDFFEEKLIQFTLPFFKTDEKTQIKKICLNISAALNDTNDLGIRSKAMWLAKYFNESVKRLNDTNLLVNLE